MYNLSSICFMCLRNNKSLKQMFHKDAEINIFKQVIYILPEFVSLERTTPFKICTTCYAAVNSFFTLKKMWLENYSRLRNQIKIVQDPGNIQIDKHIKKKIEDPLMLEQKNQTEEFISSEDESYFQPIEFVKCGVADEVQNESTSDKNNLNTNTSKRPQYYNKESDADSANWLRTGVREFKCLLCNKTFTAKQSVKYHVNLHNGVSNFECTVCKKKFSRDTHLKEHMKLHVGIKEVECSISNKKFMQNSHLKMHEGVKDYECAVCNRKFMLKSTFTRHLKFHVGIKDNKCSICGRIFRQNGHLKVHLKTHKGVKNIECSICNKKFMQNCHLKKHLKVHEGVKDFECAVCNKKFVLKSTLTWHIKSHEGVKD